MRRAGVSRRLCRNGFVWFGVLGALGRSGWWGPVVGAARGSLCRCGWGAPGCRGGCVAMGSGGSACWVLWVAVVGGVLWLGLLVGLCVAVVGARRGVVAVVSQWGSPGSVDIGLSGFCRGDVLRFEL